MRYRGGGREILFAGVVRFVSSNGYHSECMVGVGWCVVDDGNLGYV